MPIAISIDKENPSINGFKGLAQSKSSKSNNDKLKLVNNSSSDINQKMRRALGDVMNTTKSTGLGVSSRNVINNKQQALKSPKIKHNCNNNINNNPKLKHQHQQQADQLEEIENNTNKFYYDNFNDLLSDENKLSTMLLETKSIIRLQSECDIDKFMQDKFQTKQILGDRQLRKNIEKEGKSMNSIQIFNDLPTVDINDEDLFVPPADW